MSDLYIAQAGGVWDLVIEDGDAVLVHELDENPLAAEVAQRVVYEISTWLGESPYDRTAGIPYLDGVFGFEPVPGVAAMITQTALETEGVTEIEGTPRYLLDTTTGVLSLDLQLVVGDTTVPLALSVGAV